MTCRIVRPLRAKHCAATDRCIEQFDHFCPWVGNAIGRRNRALFLAFLFLELAALVITVVVGAVRTAARLLPALLTCWAGDYKHLEQLLVERLRFCYVGNKEDVATEAFSPR